jgi:hypothetical protein
LLWMFRGDAKLGSYVSAWLVVTLALLNWICGGALCRVGVGLLLRAFPGVRSGCAG